MKTMSTACDLLQQQMTHFDTAKEVNKLAQPSLLTAATVIAAAAVAAATKPAAKSTSHWRSSSKSFQRGGEANAANLTCFNCKASHHIRDCTAELTAKVIRKRFPVCVARPVGNLSVVPMSKKAKECTADIARSGKSKSKVLGPTSTARASSPSRTAANVSWLEIASPRR